jgi:methionyl-tRNA formyltransferase
MHGSLLPKYRGRVPVNWAIIHGERETGATLHVMNEKPDAGASSRSRRFRFCPTTPRKDVFNKVTVAAEMALTACLPTCWPARAHRHGRKTYARGSYFGGRKAEDGRIDWSRPAARSTT